MSATPPPKSLQPAMVSPAIRSPAPKKKKVDELPEPSTPAVATPMSVQSTEVVDPSQQETQPANLPSPVHLKFGNDVEDETSKAWV